MGFDSIPKETMMLMKTKPGFITFFMLELENEGDQSRKLNFMHYIFYDPLKPCLCGKKKLFGACCNLKKLQVYFLLDTDASTYSKAVIFTYTWKNPNFQKIREILNQSERFHQGEDSDDKCFWNYRGEQDVIMDGSRMLFGNITLTKKALKVEALSESRYESLMGTLKILLPKDFFKGNLVISNAI